MARNDRRTAAGSAGPSVAPASSDPGLIKSMRMWLKERTGSDDVKCPVCARVDFGINRAFVLPDPKAPSTGMGIVPATCNFCGYVLIFDLETCAPSIAKQYRHALE